MTWDKPTTGTFKVVVGANDGSLGTVQGFTLTARANQLPVISSTNPPTGAIPNVEYVYDAIARDPDGGKLTYAINPASISKGITIDENGRLRWTPTETQIGKTDVTLTITDAAGAKVVQEFGITVAQDSEAPKVKLGFAGSNPAEVGSTVVFQLQATDNIKVTNLELVVGGKAVILDQFGRAAVELDKAGAITSVAKAYDQAGNVVEDRFTINVFDPFLPQNAPKVRLDLEAISNNTITNLQALQGLVDDPDDNLSSYIVEVALQGTDNWTTIIT